MVFMAVSVADARRASIRGAPMTSHSEHGGYIRGLAASLIVDKGPADTGACRDALVNNPNHLLDECTQVRASITLKAGGFYTGSETGGVAAVDTFEPPFGLYPLRIPLQIRSDGRSVLIVPHLRASVSAGTLTIRVFLSFDPGTTRSSVGVPAVGSTCAEVTTTSTTGADLAPTPIYLPIADYEAARDARPSGRVGMAYPSLTGIGGPGISFAPIVYMHLRWKSSSGDPRLYGLSAREYIG
jgi:hypothetical protein